MSLNLPLQLPHPGAASLLDAAGATVAECRDAETAAVILGIVNDAWRLELAEDGSVFDQRTHYAALMADVARARGQG